MANTFSEDLWFEATTIWRKIQIHPFLQELEQGILPIEKFKYYLIQDFHYMAAYGRTVASLLSKAGDELAYRILPRVSTPIERPLHANLFELLRINESAVIHERPSPTNLSYSNHLEVSAAVGGIEVAAAALLPCPLTYHELSKTLQSPDHPIYKVWVESYASGILETSVREWRRFVDEFDENSGDITRKKMRSAFTTSVKFEYQFWTMAYNMEPWPLIFSDPKQM